MYLSIIGSRGCGKSTLFRAFNGQAASNNGKGPGIGIVEVPDERVDHLSAIFNPRKRSYGRIEVTDLAPITEGDREKEMLPAKQMQQMRQSDAFILVLRNFDGLSAPDPVSELHGILSEFILADLLQVENRLQRISKQNGKKGGAEMEQERLALELCLPHLSEGNPLSALELFRNDGAILRGFQFLSLKPLMIVLNCSEESLASAAEVIERLRPGVPESTPIIAACAKLEAELALMEPAEREEFMAEYAIGESLRFRLIRLAFDTLGLISFLTVGDDECRAWPIRRGLTAQEAAGAIHSDLADRFIRAETVSYHDFMEHGDLARCKKAGVWRLEGKQYVVQDGDILSIRAGN